MLYLCVGGCLILICADRRRFVLCCVVFVGVVGQPCNPGTLTFFVNVGTCDGKSALEGGCDAPNHLTRSTRAVSG